MDRESIKELVREVAGPNVAFVDHSEWVGFNCILAPWTHASGSDSSPSCGISVKDDDVSIYHCWSCGSKGTVAWLLRQIERYTGDNLASLIREVDKGEFLGGSLPEWGARSTRSTVAMKILDTDTFLGIYEDAKGHRYLKSRGISDSIVDKLQLRVDPQDSAGIERILFPVFGRQNQLYGFTGRATDNSSEPRVRDYHGLRKKDVLLGIHLITPEDTGVVVVEGLFDYAKLVQYDVPVVASLHAGITAGQKALLADLGLPVTLMFDNDAAGRMATATAAKAIGKLLPVHDVNYNSLRKKVTVRGSSLPKDPCVCTQEQIYTLLETAVIL